MFVILLHGEVCKRGVAINPSQLTNVSDIVEQRTTAVVHPLSTVSVRRYVAPPHNAELKISSHLGVIAHKERQ